MRYSPFYHNFSEFKKAHDGVMTKDILLSEIANAIVNHRERVIDKLNQSGLQTDSSISQKDLAEKVMDSLPNKKFLGGLSSVIAGKNASDYQSFNADNGGKTKPQDYTKDIFFAINGTVKAADKEELVQKTEQLLPVQSSKGSAVSGWCVFGIVLLGAAAVYAIGVKKIDLKLKAA